MVWPMPEAPAGARESEILTRAVVRAQELLHLSQNELARILGISESSVSRLSRGRLISVASKEGELAILFLRVFRSLDALVGGDTHAARQWLRGHNYHLGGVPATLLQSVAGLAHVIEYLDAMRGHL